MLFLLALCVCARRGHWKRVVRERCEFRIAHSATRRFFAWSRSGAANAGVAGDRDTIDARRGRN